MFAEYLTDATWKAAAPGIMMCAVQESPDRADLLPLQLRSDYMEIFFCFSGKLTISRRSGGECRVGNDGLVLLTDSRDLLRACVEQPLEGICLSVHRRVVRPNFENACASLQLDLKEAQINQMLQQNHGLVQIPNTMWNRNVRSMLRLLPPEEQPRYCVLKCLELLYLLCTRSALLEQSASHSPSWSYLSITMAQMRSYIETHLDEKLTISQLSRQYHLSPTALKSAFRFFCGQPVHSWILEKRLEKSTRLLLGSSLTVLQISQEVGYESVGQFNVVFKRQFGVTPSQYRKMSQSKTF